MIFTAPCLCLAACTGTSTQQPHTTVGAPTIRNVKTTAYTESEADHLVYGAKSAVGGRLKYGKVRSAAADWSVYPVGTVFQIEGDPHSYEVDDYGSALVGTGTIDIYKPSKAAMRDYGARHVNIKIIKWGSTAESLAIMKPREKVKPHVRAMIAKLERDGMNAGGS